MFAPPPHLRGEEPPVLFGVQGAGSGSSGVHFCRSLGYGGVQNGVGLGEGAGVGRVGEAQEVHLRQMRKREGEIEWGEGALKKAMSKHR